MIKLRYADINLTTGEIKDYPVSDKYQELYLGGKSLGARILYDEMPPHTHPLSAEAIIIINTGPLTGTGAPCSSRFSTTIKNVLTGGIGQSNCGGLFGVKLRRAGFDGLIIRGKASSWSYIEILDGEIVIKDASHLVGLNSEETQAQFPESYGKFVIGPAGENLVSFACVVSGERVAGRCGVGAVMGSKNLKALVSYGTRKVPVHDPQKFSQIVREWNHLLKAHQMTGSDLGNYGTALWVNRSNRHGILPTRNFQKGRFEEAERISGEYLADNYLVRNSGCVSCPIRCERRVMLGNREIKGAEFETIGLLGSNIENSDLNLINEWNYHLDLLGIDSISTGGTLAFAMELQERGIKDFGLKFGKTDNILEALYNIAYRRGEQGELADGVKILSEKYGGEEFAIHSKGLELAAYDPRISVGLGLGYATANRGGCHLNAGYAALLEALGPIPVPPTDLEAKPGLVVFLQNGMDAVSLGGSCVFTLMMMIPNPAFKIKDSSPLKPILGKGTLLSGGLLNNLGKMLPWIIPININALLPHGEALYHATGIKMTMGKFLQAGERCFNMERLYNIREGLTGADDSLPSRMTDQPLEPERGDTIVDLEKMLPVFYRARGWDEKGIPTSKKLKQLKIDM